MQRINVIVTDAAKEKLLAYQRKHAYKKQDDAMTAILETMEL
jgi:hypothetical protein